MPTFDQAVRAFGVTSAQFFPPSRESQIRPSSVPHQIRPSATGEIPMA